MASSSLHLESTQARGRLSPVKTAQVLLLQRAQGLFSDPRNAAAFYDAGRIQRGETIVRVAGWGEVGVGGLEGGGPHPICCVRIKRIVDHIACLLFSLVT